MKKGITALKLHTQPARTAQQAPKTIVNSRKAQNASQGRTSVFNGVLSFEERLQVKRQAEEDEADRVKFRKLLSYAYPAEKMELLEALEDGDKARYMAAVNPIVRRMVLKEFNELEWSK